MSDFSQGPGWWQASDGKWYPPEQHPGQAPPPYAQPPAAYGYGYATTPVAPRTDGLAVGALVSAIVGVVLLIFCVGIFGTIAAIPMGFISRKRIRQSGGALQGEGLALAGAIVGIVATAGYLLLLVLVVASSSSSSSG
ncbi:MAG: DUF4190 domain-containing protein [Acidimicrobiales bacterium]